MTTWNKCRRIGFILAGLLIGGATAGAPSALAGTTGCAFSNGCATLHGQDGNGAAVALDSKYQSAKPGTIQIGYPDKPGDGATDYDAVLHFTTNHVSTFSDTSVLVQQPANNAFVHRYFLGCVFHNSSNDTATNFDLGLLAGGPASGHSLTWSLSDSTDPDVTIDPITGSISDPDHTNDVSSTANVTVVDGYGDIANAVVSITEGSTGVSGITVNSGNCTEISFPPAEQSGGVQFTNVDNSFTGGLPNSQNHPESYLWSASGLPSGLSIDAHTGFIAPGTTAPGSYGVKVTATDASGAASTITFTLQVNATETHVANHTPYYTFVYAKNGVWSNECVTDINGSGAIALQQCTLGRNRYQDWFALNNAGDPQGNLQTAGPTTMFHMQNFLASISDAANSCLIDRSTLNPGTPQTNAVDTASNGRQLRVDGSCASSGPVWGWGS